MLSKRPGFDILLPILLLLLLAGASWQAIAQTQTTTQPLIGIVNINYAHSLQFQKNMSGFFHSVTPTVTPDAMLLPLHPATWRVGPQFELDNNYTRFTAMGITPELVISDEYGNPDQNYKGHGAPWENNYANWDAVVTALAQKNAGRCMVWDIWNEPNYTYFWPGTQDQYFEAYKHAYTILRNTLGPSAVIAGPSSYHWDPGFIKAFLDYSLANNLEVNVINWHELDDRDIPYIADHVQYIRNNFQNNPAYSRLRIQQIQINEAVGQNSRFRPGEIIGVLNAAERGQADATNKACFPDSTGKLDCFNNTLDGVMTPTYQPRSAWWTYKTYADTVGSRVATWSSDLHIPIIAGASSRGTPTQQAETLVGYLDFYNPAQPQAVSPPMARVSLTMLNVQALPYIGTASLAHLRIASLPDTGEAALTSPPVLFDQNVPVVNGMVKTIFQLPIHSGVVVTLSSATGG